jgi:hypothetical protein
MNPTSQEQSMRRTPLVLAAVVAGTAALAVTAGAANAAQPVTFTINGGGLSISAPTATTNLTVNGGATQASGQLGATTVTDLRATFLGSYTVNMTAAAFDHDALNDGGYQIAASNVTAYSGTATTTGTVTTLPTSSLLPASVGGASGATLFQGTLQAGVTTATYNPTLLVAIPSIALSGSYTGSVTQTVS